MALHALGSRPMNQKWTPQLRISGVNAPAEEWLLDPALPPLGADPKFPNDLVVIPRGRIVAIQPADYNATTANNATLSYNNGAYSENSYRSVITLADGKNNTPFGYAAFNFFKHLPVTNQDAPTVAKYELIQLPYVAAVNDAYSSTVWGRSAKLQRGDKIMPYFGSVTSTIGAPQDKGKVVKWVPKQLYSDYATGAATGVVLDAATLPGITPRVVYAASGTAIYTGAAPTVAWSASDGAWKATFETAVNHVIYEFGADYSQCIGEVVGLELINDGSSNTHELDGWLKWVVDNFEAWQYPPILKIRPTSSTTETFAASDLTTNLVTLANHPIHPFRAITITVTGTLTELDGTQTSLSGTTLSLANDAVNDFTRGQYYEINPITGQLRFYGNLSLTAATVAYSYFAPYADGLAGFYGGQGQVGLTDGTYSGVAGTPAELEVPSVAGVMRVAIY